MKKSLLYIALCCAFLGGGSVMSLPARAATYDFSKADWKGCDSSDNSDSDNTDDICNKIKQMGSPGLNAWMEKSSTNSKSSSSSSSSKTSSK